MVKHPTRDIIHETSANFNSFFVILQNMYFLLRTDGFYSKTYKQRNSFLVDIPLAKSPKLGIVEKAVETMWVCVEISPRLGLPSPGATPTLRLFFRPVILFVFLLLFFFLPLFLLLFLLLFLFRFLFSFFSDSYWIPGGFQKIRSYRSVKKSTPRGITQFALS